LPETSTLARIATSVSDEQREKFHHIRHQIENNAARIHTIKIQRETSVNSGSNPVSISNEEEEEEEQVIYFNRERQNLF
jgi:hypothetical protein